MEISLEDQRLLAYWVWRDEWIAALRLRGERGRKRRKHLRNAAIAKILKDDLRARGESCATCSGYRKGICEKDSDFYGDVHVKPHHLCADWTCKRPNI